MEDNLLEQIALEAKETKAELRQRRQALDRLFRLIRQSRRLARPQQGMWPSQVYEDLYNEAFSRTMLEVAQRIQEYDSAYPVMAWVNSLLNYRFRDVVQEYYKGGMTGIPRSTERQVGVKIRSLDQLEIDLSTPPSESNLLHQFIHEDPESRLIEHIRGRPEATFQFLLKAQLKDLSWDEISEILGPPPIPKQTLCSFFKRQLQTLNDYFQKYLSE